MKLNGKLMIEKFDSVTFSGSILLKGYDGRFDPPDYECPLYVSTIAEGAFWRCSQLKSIILPDTIQAIGPHAFSFCNQLEHIGFPAQMTRLEQGMLEGCERLKSVVLPKALKHLDNHVFSMCVSLKYIVIYNAIETVGSFVFNYCHQLKYIILMQSNQDDVERITALMPQSVKNKIFSSQYFARWSLHAQEALTRYNPVEEVTKLLHDQFARLSFFKPNYIPFASNTGKENRDRDKEREGHFYKPVF